MGDGVDIRAGRGARVSSARRVGVDVAMAGVLRVGLGVRMGEAPDVAGGTDGAAASAIICAMVLATAPGASSAGVPNDVSRSRYTVTAPNSPRHSTPRTTNTRREILLSGPRRLDRLTTGILFGKFRFLRQIGSALETEAADVRVRQRVAKPLCLVL